MERIIKFFLIILVAIAFLGGVRLGRKLQSIDTPSKTIVKPRRVVVTPKVGIKKYTLTNCAYSLVLPDYLKVKLASDSAQISQDKQNLLIECQKSLNKHQGTRYLNSQTNKIVYISGSKSFLKEIKAGLDRNFTESMLNDRQE